MFFWSENILWKEDLVERHATVYLGGKDSIINTREVRAYLQNADEHRSGKDEGHSVSRRVKEIAAGSQMGGKLDVVWCADLDHGQIFQISAWRKLLRKEILAHARFGRSTGQCR